MNIDQWKAACIAYFQSGRATDEHWEVMAAALLVADEVEGLDADLGAVIDLMVQPSELED